MDKILKQTEDNVTELLGGKINKEKVNILTEKLDFVIKTKISGQDMDIFRTSIRDISNYISKDVNYLIIKLFIQIGKPDTNTNEDRNSRILDFKDKNNVYLFIKPKIKNYVTFKTLEGVENYQKEEMDKNEFFLLLPVENGKISTINLI